MIDVKNSEIFDCADETLKIGTLGYFSDSREFETYVEGTLEGFTRNEFMTFTENSCEWFDFFIPKDKAVFRKKQRKLIPFRTVMDFKYTTHCLNVGLSTLTFRNKNESYVETCPFLGYRIDKENEEISIILGLQRITLKDLFENYEYYEDETWKPFGILIDEND